MVSLKNMNNYAVETRRRSRSLLVVEGKHEKDELFWLVFKCFPEMNIDIDDVWIYGTNIYKLYEDIVTNTFERKIELNTSESIKKLADIMKSEAPVKPLSTRPFSTTERDRSEKLLKQYLSR